MHQNVTSKYINQIYIDIKGEIGNNILTVDDFNNPLTSKTNHTESLKGTVIINGILDQLNLTNSYKTLHPKTAE